MAKIYETGKYNLDQKSDGNLVETTVPEKQKIAVYKEGGENHEGH